MSNQVSVVPATATIDSPTVIVFSDILNFNPNQYSSIDDAIADVGFMLGSVNRASLYSAYVIGKLVDPQLLEKKFGISSISALAKIMGYSTMTLTRYRTVNQMLTPAQVEKLANRRVSINAVLELAKCRKDHPKESEAVLDMLLTGASISTESDVEAAILERVVNKLLPHNLAPGAEPEVVEGTLIENNEDESTAASQFIEASHNPILDAEDNGEEFEEEPTAAAATCSQDSDGCDDGGSLNVKEIKTILRTVRKWIVAAKRDTVSIQGIGDKMDAILDKGSVILGDEESYDEYFDQVSQLYESLLASAESIIPEIQRGIEHGYIKRGVLLPETADFETLFRKEN